MNNIAEKRSMPFVVRRNNYWLIVDSKIIKLISRYIYCIDIIINPGMSSVISCAIKIHARNDFDIPEAIFI